MDILGILIFILDEQYRTEFGFSFWNPALTHVRPASRKSGCRSKRAERSALPAAADPCTGTRRPNCPPAEQNESCRFSASSPAQWDHRHFAGTRPAQQRHAPLR